MRPIPCSICARGERVGFLRYASRRFILWIGRIIASFGVIALLFSFSESAHPTAPTVAIVLIIVGIVINWYGAYKLR